MADKQIKDLTELTSGNIENEDFLEIQEDDSSVSKKVTVEVLNEIEAAAREAQDDVIENGVGLQADGTYDQPSGTNYLDSTTDVMDALETLDDEIYSVSNIQTAYAEINASEAHGLFTTPIEIVAAQGATSYIEVISASAYNNYDSDPFAIGAGEKLVLELDTGSSHIVEWTESFIEATSDTMERGAFTSNVEMLANKKLQVTTTAAITNDASDDGSFIIFVAYRVINTAIPK